MHGEGRALKRKNSSSWIELLLPVAMCSVASSTKVKGIRQFRIISQPRIIDAPPREQFRPTLATGPAGSPFPTLRPLSCWPAGRLDSRGSGAGGWGAGERRPPQSMGEPLAGNSLPLKIATVSSPPQCFKGRDRLLLILTI